MSSMAYSLRGVTVGYGPASAAVLQAVDLDLELGSVVALSGVNGVGKSTLLKLLALELAPTAGHLHCFGEAITATVPPGGQQRRQLGLLPQDPYLFQRSPLDNITMGLRFRGISKAGADARARQLLRQLDLEFLAQRSLVQLSGGERQKLAIVRLLVLEPRVLLLDEPFSALDADSRHDLGVLLRKACRLEQRLLVFSSHDPLQARLWADRVLQLAEGRVAPARALNLYEGTVDTVQGRFDTGRLQLYILPGGLPGGHACIRPEVVVLSTECPHTSMNNTFQGRVLSMTPEGGGVMVAVHCHGETICALITAAAAKTLSLDLGAAVWVGFKAAAVQII